MKCPICPDTALLMTNRQGVETDYCPQCRGVWLDRGELDKLIERAATASPPASDHFGTARSQPDFVDSDHHGGARYRGNRKKSWLSDIFD